MRFTTRQAGAQRGGPGRERARFHWPTTRPPFFFPDAIEIVLSRSAPEFLAR
jgi:hypothetical protein